MVKGLMKDQQRIYSMFYKAQDRFLAPVNDENQEPVVIKSYIDCGLALALYHEKNSEHENVLLCELYLRQLFFHLIEAIESPKRSISFRQMCLDSIHSSFFCLKRHYYQQTDGAKKFLPLQKTLQQVQAPLG